MVLLVTVEQAAAALCAAVERAQTWLSHPLVTALQFHGIWLVLLLATLWVLAGKARMRELQRQRRRTLGRPAGALTKSSGSRGSLASLAAEQEVREGPNRGRVTAACGTRRHKPADSPCCGIHVHRLAAARLQAGQPRLPTVTVVLPVRGCRSHSVANWRSMLNLDYGGVGQGGIQCCCANQRWQALHLCCAEPGNAAHAQHLCAASSLLQRSRRHPSQPPPTAACPRRSDLWRRVASHPSHHAAARGGVNGPSTLRPPCAGSYPPAPEVSFDKIQ